MCIDELNGERVIDRSGDIDQRPPDEIGLSSSSVVPYRRAALASVAAVDVPREVVHLREAGGQASSAAAATAERLQAEIDAAYAKAADRLSALSDSIAAHEKKCVAPSLDAEMREARLARQTMLIENGPELAERVREEKSRLDDLDAFKAKHRITREPHYAASPVLGLGVLCALILTEAVVNGVLFAGTSEQGLFGGWLEALVLAIANAGAAFLIGYFALPQLNRRSFVARAGAGVFVLAGVAAIFAINLFGAHYRDYRERAFADSMTRVEASRPPPKAAAPLGTAKQTLVALPAKPITETKEAALPPAGSKSAEADALRRLVENPFRIEGFSSVFLLVIGLCAAFIAAADGYKFDDPIPGYGRRHRSYRQARAATAATLRRAMHRAGGGATAAFQALDRKLDRHAAALADLSTRHDAWAAERRRLQVDLDATARRAEAEIESLERLSRRTARGGFMYALASKQLPPLELERGKFLETQEKKLKASQKAVQKEKDESFRFLDAAADGFETILAEAVRTSFEGARQSTQVANAGAAAC
ncbi:hypothetical protein JDN40_06225 [Rhodomicrobium vannielii ATCC 17100]|uniref:hypothetical protein n=1 Tax=Rhodomicrobium vannielii TaxID=1069 RepID=UPI001918CAD1|nr:hypothetical protein [Rhodomicrobium vannielii]MBJ7533695.1 hypothetical protein [Rhodomicrobium vannielii ATCC 17100]